MMRLHSIQASSTTKAMICLLVKASTRIMATQTKEEALAGGPLTLEVQDGGLILRTHSHTGVKMPLDAILLIQREPANGAIVVMSVGEDSPSGVVLMDSSKPDTTDPTKT